MEKGSTEELKTKRPRFKFAAGLAVGMVGLFLLYPTERLTVPAWSAQFVGEAGKPFGQICVKEQWVHYDVEFHSHEERKYTDENGWVSFPERTVRANMLKRLYVFFANGNVREGWHSGPGATASIFGPIYKEIGQDHPFGSAEYTAETNQLTKIVVAWEFETSSGLIKIPANPTSLEKPVAPRSVQGLSPAPMR